MLKRLAHPPRYYYYLFATLIITLAIIIQSLRLLAPQIDRLRPSIELFLSEEINAQVSIGDIQGSWYGLRPHVLVKDLVVENNESVVGLRIGHADFTLDLLKSALYSQWIWRQVKFDDIYIALSQNNQGQWRIGGLPIEKKADSSWRYRSPAELFQTVSKIDVSNADIAIIFANKKAIRSQIPLIKIENYDDFHRLTAQASVDNTDTFTMVIEQNETRIDGGASDSTINNSASVTGFMKLTDFPLQTIANGVLSDGVLNSNTLTTNTLQQSTINLSLWFDFSSQHGFDVVGDMSINNLSSSSYLDSFALNTSIASDIYGHFEENAGWSLGLRDLTISNPDIVQQVFIQQSDSGLQVMVDDLHVKEWVTWLMPRISERAQSIVETTSPAGRLSQVTIDVYTSDLKSSKLSAFVHDTSIKPFENVPGIRHINGFLSAGMTSGYVNIDTTGLELEPTKVYDQALVFDEIKGQVAWHLRPESNQIIVNSSHLLTESSFGRASGIFYLDVPWEKDSRKSDFVLQVGLQDSSYERAKHLIPRRVPEPLRHWLEGRVLAGDAQQAGFTYRGGFSGGDHVRSIQLFFDVQNVDLHYSDDWPDLMKASGHVLVDNQLTKVYTTEAYVKGEAVDNLVVTWIGDERKELNVDVRSQVSAELGLYFLNNTWLKSKVGETFSSWSGEGSIHVDVNVDIPLFATAGDRGIEPKQQVQISFNDNIFRLPEQRLDFSYVSGDLFFSNQKGLYSDNLSLTLFGQSLPLSVVQINSSNNTVVQIKGRSTVGTQDLSSWLQMPELSYLSGQLPYSIQLDIPLKDNKDYVAKLLMTSDLLGVNSQFPAPLGKAKSERRDFSITGSINPLESLYTLRMDESFQAEFVLGDHLQSGFVALGKAALITVPNERLHEKDKLTVKARLDSINFDEWSNLLAYSLEARISEDSKQTNQFSLAHLPIQYDIRTDKLKIKETAVPNVQVMGNKQGDDWRADIRNDWLKAKVVFDSEFNNPIEVSFDYLNIPSNASKDKSELAENRSNDPDSNNVDQEKTLEIDPLADFDLSLVKPAIIDIQSLTYNYNPLGQWRFTINPSNNDQESGIYITDIYGEFSGLRLAGSEDGSGASLTWLAKNNIAPMMTKLTGKLSGGGVQQLFEDWGYPAPLTSQSTLFDMNTSWQGSPAFFSIENMSGNVYANLQEGVFVQGKESAATGVLRLFGLFNFNTWARRLKLDFSDVYKKGVAFDSLTSRLVFDEDFIYFQEPLLLKGPASEFTMAGKIDYPNENIDAVLVATLPVSGNLTFAAAFAGGLPAAAGVYIVSKIFKPQVDKVSSLTYSIKGHWNEPKVAFIRLFDNDAKKDKESE